MVLVEVALKPLSITNMRVVEAVFMVGRPKLLTMGLADP